MTDEKKYYQVPQEEGENVPVKKYGLGVRHLQMFCMSACMMTLFITRSCMGVAVLAMTDVRRQNDTNIEIYNWDKKTQGLVLSSFFWGYMANQIPAGTLSKRFGGKPILQVAVITSGLVCLVIPILASYGGWILVCMCRVVMGLSQACTFPASHTLLGQWLPASERTNYVGIVYGGSALGTIIGMPLSGILSETALGWKMIFYCMTVLCSVTSIMWHFLAASTPGSHRMITEEEMAYISQDSNISRDNKKYKTPWKEIFTSKAMFAIIIAHIGFVFSYILVLVDLPTFLEKGLHVSLRNSATLSALPYLGFWIGGIISGALSQLLINKKILSLVAIRKTFNTIAFVGFGVGLMILSLCGPNSTHWAVTALVGALFCQGFTSVGFMVNYIDLSPNFAGVLLSIGNFISNSASIVTPIIISFILKNDPTDISRWRVVFLLFAGIAIVTSLVYALLGTTDTAPWDDPNYFNTHPDYRNNSVNEKDAEANKNIIKTA